MRSYASSGIQQSSPMHAKRATGAESRREERGIIISSAWCRGPPLRATAEVTSWTTQAKGAGRASGRELAARRRRALSQRRHAYSHAPNTRAHGDPGGESGPSVGSPIIPTGAPSYTIVMVPYSSSQSRCSTSAALEAAAKRKEPCCTRPVHGENGLGQRAREGARSEKRLAHGRLQTPPRPRRALPASHPLLPPTRLRSAASAEVSGVSGVLRAGLFDLGTNQHCRWLFFVRRRVMGHDDDIARRGSSREKKS